MPCRDFLPCSKHVIGDSPPHMCATMSSALDAYAQLGVSQCHRAWTRWTAVQNRTVRTSPSRQRPERMRRSLLLWTQALLLPRLNVRKHPGNPSDMQRVVQKAEICCACCDHDPSKHKRPAECRASAVVWQVCHQLRWRRMPAMPPKHRDLLSGCRSSGKRRPMSASASHRTSTRTWRCLSPCQ